MPTVRATPSRAAGLRAAGLSLTAAVLLCVGQVGCDADANTGANTAGPAAVDAAPGVAGSTAAVETDTLITPADPDDAATLDAIREAVDSGRGGAAAGPMREALDAYDRRDQDPMTALQSAAVLMQAGMSLMPSDEELGYDAMRLAGNAAESAVADGPPGGVPPQLFATIFYNQACALSRDGRVEPAVAALGRAAEYGWTQWDHAAADPDLAAVRDAGAFEERLAGWKAAAAEVPVPSFGDTPAPRDPVAEAREELEGGEPYPLSFTYAAIDGTEHSLADYAGKVVIVDFWGTWCPPCRAEIPSFVKLQDEYGDGGLQILGLNYRDEPEEIESFADEYGINYPTGPGDAETRDMVPGFRGYPTTVFVGRDGTVRATVVGTHSYEFLEAVVKELLAEGTGTGDAAAADADAGGADAVVGADSDDA